MSKFSLDKKGYNTKEVDDYINNLCLKYEEKLSEQKDRVFALKNELDQVKQKLNEYIEKDRQISEALMYAVEKANEIEDSAKKIYELEIKRVRLLYKRWEELLLEVEEKCPQVNSNGYINGLIEAFKASINDVLEQNLKLGKVKTKFEGVKQKLKQQSDDYIKNILNKMDYAFAYQTKMDLDALGQTSQNITKIDISSIMANHNKKNRIKEIESKIIKLKKHEDVIESYLNSDIEDSFSNSVYAKTITRKNISKEDDSIFNYPYPEPNESGFDLKEALNPKEDLDEIMKDFDFYNGEEK